MTLRHRLLLILMFNLVPLGFVAIGEWRAFDVIAFYWVEVIAAGLFALARQAVTAFTKLADGKRWQFLGSLPGLLLLPVHYGFFVIMMAFMVGGFLPEGTATRKLSDPLVPARMIIDNMEFQFAFIIAVVWQGALFLAERLAPAGTRREQDPTLRAYGQMFVLFTACFAGVLMAGVTASPLWGAALLISIKTAAALLVASATEDRPVA